MIELIDQYIKHKKIFEGKKLIRAILQKNAMIVIENCKIDEQLLEIKKGFTLTSNYNDFDDEIDCYKEKDLDSYFASLSFDEIINSKIKCIKANPTDFDYVFDIGEQVYYEYEQKAGIVIERYPIEKYKIKIKGKNFFIASHGLDSYSKNKK